MTEEKRKPAKLCYSHIGGKLGALLLDAFTEKGWLAKAQPGDKHFYITDEGSRAFKKMGIDLSQIREE